MHRCGKRRLVEEAAALGVVVVVVVVVLGAAPVVAPEPGVLALVLVAVGAGIGRRSRSMRDRLTAAAHRQQRRQSVGWLKSVPGWRSLRCFAVGPSAGDGSVVPSTVVLLP